MIEHFQLPSVTQLNQLASEMNTTIETPEDLNLSMTTDVSTGTKCPIIINPFGEGNKLVMAEFGMSPAWAKYAVSYPSVNAPMETIKGVKTFKKPYRKSQFCLIPITGFRLPNNRLVDTQENSHDTLGIFTVAGIYEYNAEFETPIHSVALLTRKMELVFLNDSAPSQPMNTLLEVLPNHRDIFLVSNWKFNKGYLNEIQDVYMLNEDCV